MNKPFADRVLEIIQANPEPNSLLGVKEPIRLTFHTSLSCLVVYFVLTEVETLSEIESIKVSVPVKRSFMIEYSRF